MIRDSEKTLERQLNKAVKDKGGMSIKLLTALFRGLPDRLCLLPVGRLFFIEMKSTGDKPSKIQQVVHRRLAKIGFPVYVLDTKVKLDEFIKNNL